MWFSLEPVNKKFNPSSLVSILTPPWALSYKHWNTFHTYMRQEFPSIWHRSTKECHLIFKESKYPLHHICQALHTIAIDSKSLPEMEIDMPIDPPPKTSTWWYNCSQYWLQYHTKPFLNSIKLYKYRPFAMHFALMVLVCQKNPN